MPNVFRNLLNKMMKIVFKVYKTKKYDTIDFKMSNSHSKEKIINKSSFRNIGDGNASDPYRRDHCQCNVTHIGRQAFDFSKNLEAITVEEGNLNYCSLDGILYEKATPSIFFVPHGISGDITLLDGITTIKASAFEQKNPFNGNCHF